MYEATSVCVKLETSTTRSSVVALSVRSKRSSTLNCHASVRQATPTSRDAPFPNTSGQRRSARIRAETTPRRLENQWLRAGRVQHSFTHEQFTFAVVSDVPDELGVVAQTLERRDQRQDLRGRLHHSAI